MNNPITIETIVKSDIENVWKAWTSPEALMEWNHASDDWECPQAENDLRVGGKFSATMAAKDGSMSFDFGGTYTEILEHEVIASVLGDGRHVEVVFTPLPDGVLVTEKFEAETENSREMQQAGWQAILDNFKAYVEKSV